MASYTYQHIELGNDHNLGCKCCRLQSGVDLPVPKKLSNDEIKNLTRKFGSSIIRNWTMLNAIIKRFEPTIQKRWLKKTDQKRRQILLNAWPNMASTHRPDFMSFRDPNKKVARTVTTNSAAMFLWPNINLEDLLQPHILPLFIHSRSRNLPHLFVESDIKRAHVGAGWDNEMCGEQQSVYLDNSRSPRSYGKLQATTCHQDSSISLVFTLAKGLLGLEIQDGIYTFLLTVVLEILHDVKQPHLWLAECQPTPALLQQPATTKWSDLAEQALTNTYQAPQALDLSRMKELIGSRRASAEDHVWLLREDPAYFADTLKEWREHCSHSHNDCGHEWGHAAHRMISDAATKLVCYDHIYGKLMRMAPMETQLRRANHTTKRLSRQDELDWGELSVLLNVLKERPLEVLERGFPASPRMRAVYKILKEQLAGRKPGRKVTPIESRVELLFHSLTCKTERGKHGTRNLIHEFQYMLDTDNRCSELVDDWSNSQFSDLALLDELEYCIDSWTPWATTFQQGRVQGSTTVESRINDILLMCEGIDEGVQQSCVGGYPLEGPLDGRFDYPVNKRPTKENIEQMRFAEHELDTFWMDLDAMFNFQGMQTLTSVLDQFNEGNEGRQIHRTPKFKPPIILGAPPKPQPLADQDPNISRFNLDNAKDHLVTPKTKVKRKTRGKAAPTTPVTPAPQINEEAQAEGANDADKLRVVVPKRNFKTIQALFPGVGADCHQRTEVGWEDLCHTLNAIGLQPQKLYGSVWIFRPIVGGLVNAQRSIQFHEPKEVRKGHKIPYGMIRTLGRRLRHTYGWDANTFSCA